MRPPRLQAQPGGHHSAAGDRQAPWTGQWSLSTPTGTEAAFCSALSLSAAMFVFHDVFKENESIQTHLRMK